MTWLAARRWDLLWLLLFGGLSSAYCVTAAAEIGATFDEPFYVKAGLETWRTGSNKPLMKAGVMTLPVDVQTLPVYVWERVRGYPFDPVADLHTVLPVARAMTLAFWWLLLVYALRLGRTFGGAWGGRLAVALIASDPNLLAHAALATTDVASTACVLVLVYHAWHGQGRGWGRRVLVPGLCYGLATLAKASGMVFGMEAMVVLGLCHLAGAGALAGGSGVRGRLAHLWRATSGLRRDLVGSAVIGFAVVFAYTGSDWKPDAGFVRWADRLPDGLLKDAMGTVSRELRVFTNAGEGLWYQIQHNVRGHGTYLLGEWHRRAVPEYFPLALSMKVPVPTLALLAAVLLLARRQLLTPPAAIALLLLVLAPTCRVQIGIRFMLPLMAVGSVALAVAVARGRAVPRGFVAAVVAALAAVSVAAWPHGLTYFNRAWGGPAEGYRLLHDSNYDWGQGLPELRAWAAAHGEDAVAVWYFGTDPAVDIPPLRRAFLSHPVHDGTTDAIRKVCGGAPLLAVSVGCVHANDNMTPHHRLAADWVRTQTPVARTRFFHVYRVP
ncbi:MAG: hypothetical protein C0501_24765 [Isosphaera sp.]|nr:hypothetical protein [Isosphaera sp.]